MTDSASPTAAFRAARDLLLSYRDDYEAARREFTWPELGEFNWALDWFDVIAAEHPDRPALRILADDGFDVSLSYAELATRSAQVANWLRGLGVRRGDRVLLMLGNVAPLWEVILATMKLGAVIIPASTLLQAGDLVDRIARGQVRHVITDTSQLEKFGGIAGDWTRIAVDDSAGGGGSDAAARPRTAGTPTPTRSPVRPDSHPTASPGPATRCCSTSPRVPRPSPSWPRTRRSATRWGICPRCTGSASSPATCT